MCVVGWAGTTCEVNIDECASYPCSNGGTCVDGIYSYACVCPAGYRGQCKDLVNNILEIAQEIQFNGKFMPIHSYVGGRGYTEEKDVSKSLKLPQLSKLEIEMINHHLDKDLMKQLNYNLLP